MAESPTQSSSTFNPTSITSQIPIEIVSDEEMAIIEAAMAAATQSITSLARFPRNVRSVNSISLLSKRRISRCTRDPESVGDIEDSAGAESSPKKRIIITKSLLNRFRRRGLRVTDLTRTEWCEKQMALTLEYGTPKPTKAMEVGSARHAALEDEINKKVKVHVISFEDVWALKFLNFIIGSNQLLFDGLTRELPIVCFEKGVWMVGVIDEVRMLVMDKERYPILVDTKTRVQAKLPAEPQQRNGRLQLMCYKLIWDSLVANRFPVEKFYNFFSLDRHCTLSADVRENAAKLSIPAETLDDMVRYFRNTCSMLPLAHDQLLLRYELQEDQSLIGEDEFAYDANWLDSKLKSCLEFWHGEREPVYPPLEERWKCHFCKFASSCPAKPNVESSTEERTHTTLKEDQACA